MPVVNLSIDRLKCMLPSVSTNRILDLLPFIGLDIEGEEGDEIRVEYNPNRPDFSSDYGIVRALKGLLGLQTGIHQVVIEGKSGFSIHVDPKVIPLRPYIMGLIGTGGSVDNATIKQLIGMQEDLHNGVGRLRRKASIGLHNLDPIKSPLKYTAVDGGYSFLPLGEPHPMSVSQIIRESPIGIQFAHLVSQFDTYPILLDNTQEVVSLPPIVNGSLSRVDSSTRNLFVEVTGTDPKAVRDILNLVSVTLFDAGFKIKTVRVVRNHNSIETPQIPVKKISVAIAYVNSILGMELSAKEIKRCLEKSRLDASVSGGRIICSIPAYRIDITDDIDLVEEVAIGYGISRFSPTFPASSTPGGISPLSREIEAVRDSLVGLGLLETIGFSLTNADTQYSPFGIELPKQVLRVDSSKSAEHEILRSSLIPSLLQALSRNVHEAYPQRLFEIGKVFSESSHNERWTVAAVTAHADADFTESRSTAVALLRTAFGFEISTQPIEHPYYVPGRAGAIIVEGRTIGSIGEIIPRALEWFKLRMPVSALELGISELISHANKTIKEI